MRDRKIPPNLTVRRHKVNFDLLLPFPNRPILTLSHIQKNFILQFCPTLYKNISLLNA
jgi:hypothetical protein